MDLHRVHHEILTMNPDPIKSVRMDNPSIGFVDFTWTENSPLNGVFIRFVPTDPDRTNRSLTLSVGKQIFTLLPYHGTTHNREDARAIWEILRCDGWQSVSSLDYKEIQ